MSLVERVQAYMAPNLHKKTKNRYATKSIAKTILSEMHTCYQRGYNIRYP